MSFQTCFLLDEWSLFLSKYYIRVQLKYFLYYYWLGLFIFIFFMEGLGWVGYFGRGFFVYRLSFI